MKLFKKRNKIRTHKYIVKIFDTFEIVEQFEIETRSELINIYFFLRRSSSWVTILIPSLTIGVAFHFYLFHKLMIIKIDTNEVAFDLSFWVKILDLDKLWRSSSYWKSWTWLKSKILSWKTFRYLLSHWRLSKSKKMSGQFGDFQLSIIPLEIIRFIKIQILNEDLSMINYPTGDYMPTACLVLFAVDDLASLEQVLTIKSHKI